MSFIQISGLALLLFLFIQQYLIYRVKDSHWPKAAFVYRKQFLLALAIVAVYVLTLLNAYVWFRPGAPQTYSELFTNGHAIPNVFLLATFIAIIRLLLERTLDEPKTAWELLKNVFTSFRYLLIRPPDDKREIREWSGGLKLTPIWLLSFAAIIGAELIMTWIYVPAPNLPAWAMLANLLVAFCYFFWIYTSIFDKLVREHHFSGHTARRFIGSIFQAFVPFQAVVIGPQRAGKTSFCAGNTVPPEQTTERIERTTRSVDGKYKDSNFHALLTLLDTPGQCLGDHVTAIAFYRTDFLILILRENDIRWEALQSNELDSELLNVEGFFENYAAEYLHVLRQALRRGVAGQGDQQAPDIYQVRAFILFINRESPDDGNVDRVMKNPTLIRMSKLIGQRFGVSSDDCRLLWAAATNGGAARDRLPNLQYLHDVAIEQSAIVAPTEPAIQPSYNGESKPRGDQASEDISEDRVDAQAS